MTDSKAALDLENARPSSWHPKVTPYRLSVLLTTIGFGTAKTIEARTGNNMIPTTLEWIGGTFIFLFFFGFSSYDGKERVPRHLRWLFEPDCMDILWITLSVLSIERPKYTSTELQGITDSRAGSHHITFYRLLVSCTVVSFGIFKASLTYFGASIATTWTDWSIAVPLTTIFYILGLYEYNSSYIWKPFYITDRTGPFFYYGKHFLILASYASWLMISSSGLVYLFYKPDVIFRKPDMKAPATKIKSLTDIIFYYTMVYTMVAFSMIMSAVALGFLVTYSPKPELLARIAIARIGRAVQFSTQSLFRTIKPLLPVSSNGVASRRMGMSSQGNFQAQFRRYMDFFQRLCGHVFLHAISLALCLFYIGMMAGVTLLLYDDRLRRFSDNTFGVIFVLFLSILIIPVDIAVICGTLFMLYSLFFRFESL